MLQYLFLLPISSLYYSPALNPPCGSQLSTGLHHGLFGQLLFVGHCISQIFRRNRACFTLYRYIELDFLWVIDSHEYGVWEVPWSVSCKMKVQESQWCSPSPSPKVSESRQPMGSIPVWVQKNSVPAQVEPNKQVLPLLGFLFYLVSQQTGWDPPSLGKANLYTQSTDLNANFIHEHPHKYTQKQYQARYVGTLIW